MVELVETGRGNVADGLLPTLRVTFKIQMSEHAKTSDANMVTFVSPLPKQVSL